MNKMVIYTVGILFVALISAAALFISWSNPLVRLEHFASLATVIAATAAVGALVVALNEYYSRKLKDREDSRPYVVVALRPSRASFSLFDIVIENIGKSAAKNISIKFSPNHTFNGTKKKINDLKIMKNLRFMPPGNKINFYFGSALSGEPEEYSIRKEFKAKVYYTDVNGVPYDEDFACDPTDYEGMSVLELKTVHHLAKYVDQLSKHFKKSTELQDKLTNSLIKEGVKIRNSHMFSIDSYMYINMAIAIYRSPSRNEFWLKPFIYDYVLLLKQARDLLSSRTNITKTEKMIVEDLNNIISIDTASWGYKQDEIDGYFASLTKHYDALSDETKNQA